MENKAENMPSGFVKTDTSIKEFYPKTNNRFFVYMDGVPVELIHKVIRPIVSVVEGKYTYSNLVLIIWDPIVPSASQIFTDFQRENKTTFDEITLDILGPVGEVVEKWVYKNCQLQDIIYSDCDWADSQPVNIKVRLSFEECIHEF